MENNKNNNISILGVVLSTGLIFSVGSLAANAGEDLYKWFKKEAKKRIQNYRNKKEPEK